MQTQHFTLRIIPVFHYSHSIHYTNVQFPCLGHSKGPSLPWVPLQKGKEPAAMSDEDITLSFFFTPDTHLIMESWNWV